MNYLIAPLSISALSALLAAVIYITDLIVNNYGEVTIDINKGKKSLVAKGGDTFLSTLGEQHIFLPSACGGKGTCGACKLRVTSDIGPVFPTETPYLTKQELAESQRLACQIKLKKDTHIEIPEALFNIKQYEATVVSIKDLTYDIKEVYMALPEGETISFQAGQYCQLEVPAYGKIKQATFRAYSMSSAPDDSNHVEFLVRLVPDGIVTTYVHTLLKEGQQLKVTGPFGDFHLQDTGSTMICVAGGSGMAPFKSIVNHMIAQNNMDSRDIWYFFGARTTRDIFYLDWLNDLAKQHPRFHFIPALSDPEEGDGWKGETGLITEVLNHYLADIIPKELPKEGYLCGSPGMLDACMDVMKKKHSMDESKIYFDKFA